MLLSNNGGSSKTYVDDVFSTYLYTGNNSTQTITNEIDLSGKGGMVWTKGRGSPYNHGLVDTIRGGSNAISSQSTVAQWSTAAIASFNNNGYTLAPANIDNIWNSNFETYVSWTFRNADRFFTHTTISHTNGTPTNINLSGLGTVGQVIAKITNTTGDWIVWHRSLTAGNNLRLLSIAAQSPAPAWLSVSGTTATLSASAPTGTYVIYAWAHDPSADGIIQCGNLVGGAINSVNLGWEPQFIIAKPANVTGDWYVFDMQRGWTGKNGVGGNVQQLLANTSGPEQASVSFYVNSTGFAYDASLSGSTYIYLAIRRQNKPPTSGTEVYNAVARTGTGAAATVTGVGFPPDLLVSKNRNANPSGSSAWWSRAVGKNKALYSNRTDAELTYVDGVTGFDLADGVSLGADTSSAAVNYNTFQQYINHFFRRAPGFFDVVCYTGTGSFGLQVLHNLGVKPELMIAKNRNNGGHWSVMVLGKTGAADGNFVLNGVDSTIGAFDYSSTYTSTYFQPDYFNSGSGSMNTSGWTYVAYLFASLPGISKVGSYTGNGTSQTINCGFTTGARFVMIKRTDNAGDWYVWDSARGIVSANDPHLSLNTTAAEVTTDDSADPDNSGFIVNQVAATNINVTSATYIYLAIA